jgi:hypothetical protein
MTLALKPDSFDMCSRVGRQIDIRLNSLSILHKLAVPKKRSQYRLRAKDRKLLSPSELISLLNQQEAHTQPPPPTPPGSTRPEEDFIFMRQSRMDLYKVGIR